ncbi:peptide ABC transporter substrate-binding protein [Maritalea porphyrae]|uniref:Peptide ABC transporter substrate-binding protein n=1 Tax=Maritalea porphyrae TaxID=880732 RepID=A0ABQ5UM23_9HYPH|nr:peptide ABC transporter substrate-binding protein [Maritalea porphyrae]GLQ16316.1 peptide ABC transporter substrate-binding protein [Maritalea porphyrae]
MKFTSIFKMASAATIATAMVGGAAYADAMHPVTGEKLAADQTFTYRLLDGIPTLDPQLNEDVSGSDILRDLFEGLTNQDADGNTIPGVAESWEASEGNTVYTFNLRDNAKWSNGDPVTAHDFVYAWRRAADPATASPYSWYIDLMSIKNGSEVLAGDVAPDQLGVEAVDDHTFKVTLSQPLPYFVAMTTHATVFPTHQATIEAHGDQWTRPENMVSNGAYKLTEWVLKERTTRERNEMYWNNDATILDKVVTLVINDENVALTRWRAGELDRTEVPSGQYPRLKEELPDEAHSFPRLCNYYYTFNLSDSGPEAFKDVRVRKALSYAVDRDVIVENVLQGGQFPAYTFTPGATAGFDVPNVDFANMTQAERDAKAKELLAEAGYGADNPLKFDMLYNTSEGHKKIATAIAAMWKQKLGVEAVLANMEWKTFLETRGNQDFQLARGAWCGDYNEASTFLDLVTTPSGYNDGKYSNAEVDKIMADAKTSSDTSAGYTRVEQILADEMPVIPVYHYTGVMMLKKNLKGWPFGNVEQNWYSRNLYKVAE